MQLGQPGLQPAAQQRRGADQGHEAGIEVGANAFHAAAQHAERALHAAQQYLPRNGQLHAPPCAAKQGLHQLFFQLLHLVADGRLGHMQLLRCSRKATEPGSGLKAHQQLHRRNTRR